ncbi:hypothetical protein [Paludibacterium yongneupense]|uniref:hypothetical protein n=1 Tax=Paludibacterium yongneupense TaxID=400061 RepID=UPI0004276C33|nr:hypothetical protein [Paludibacterium yongneupense]
MKILMHVAVRVVSVAGNRSGPHPFGRYLAHGMLATGTLVFFALSAFETLHTGRFDELPFVEGVLGLAFGHVLARLDAPAAIARPPSV